MIRYERDGLTYVEVKSVRLLNVFFKRRMNLSMCNQSRLLSSINTSIYT